MTEQQGKLSIVATPIGNLGDMTFRAVDVLKQADRVLAEDTRQTKKLLQHYGIEPRALTACHDHNEAQMVERVLSWLEVGESIALVSDAGTPLISDPGYKTVHAVRKAGFLVEVVPGPCALVAALSVAGVATDQFHFGGFLPPKTQARQSRLQQAVKSEVTTVFYESSHRILASLQDLMNVEPGAHVVLVKELTKLHEQVKAGSPGIVVAWLEEDSRRQKGEFVLLIAPPEKQQKKESATTDLSLDQVLTTLLEELPLKQAVGLTQKLLGLKKNEVYQRALQLR